MPQDRDMTDYRDPRWAEMAKQVEDKLGLPPGVLDATRLFGEFTPNNVVSQKAKRGLAGGAKGVYQILPSTAEGIKKKYGIDADMGPMQQTLVAGHIWKDNLDRFGGDQLKAAAAYHGGFKQSNWGPMTYRYAERVTKRIDFNEQKRRNGNKVPEYRSLDDIPQAAFLAGSDGADGNVMETLRNIAAGTASTETAKKLLKDVDEGRLILPEAIQAEVDAARERLQDTEPAPEAFDQPTLDLYLSGNMAREDMIAFEEHARRFPKSIPKGFPLQNTESRGLLSGIKEAVTGEDQWTSEIAGLDPWWSSPEMQDPRTASEAWDIIKTSFGTAIADKQEMARVAAKVTGLELRRWDPKGNAILYSPRAKREFNVPPGLEGHDMMRAAAAIPVLGAGAAAGAAIAPVAGPIAAAGTAALTAAGAQAAYEAAQVPLGGEFNTGQVAAAAGAELVPGLTSAIGKGLKAMTGIGRTAETAATRGVAEVGTEALTAQQMAQAGKAAVTGVREGTREKAQTELAGELAKGFDTELAAWTDKHGLSEYVPTQFLIEGQPTQELYAALARAPESVTQQQAFQGLKELSARGDKIADAFGAAASMGDLDSTLKREMGEVLLQHRQAADKAYRASDSALFDGAIKQGLKPTAAAPKTTAVLEEVIKVAEDTPLGKAAKTLHESLNPPTKPSTFDVSGLQRPVKVEPSVQAINRARDTIKAAYDSKGILKDINPKDLTALNKAIDADRMAAAEKFGVADQLRLAETQWRSFKNYETKIGTALGKKFDAKFVFSEAGEAVAVKEIPGEIGPRIAKAAKALDRTATKELIDIVKAVPEDMRQSIVGTFFSTGMGAAIKRGDLDVTAFHGFMKSLDNNPQLKTFLMSNLGEEQKHAVKMFRKLSDNIVATTKGINKARLGDIQTTINKTNSIVAGLWSAAQTGVVSTMQRGKPSALGIVGAFGAAIKGENKAISREVSTLLGSDEFGTLVRAIARGDHLPTIKQVVKTGPFRRFFKVMKLAASDERKAQWVYALSQLARTQAAKPSPDTRPQQPQEQAF